MTDSDNSTLGVAVVEDETIIGVLTLANESAVIPYREQEVEREIRFTFNIEPTIYPAPRNSIVEVHEAAASTESGPVFVVSPQFGAAVLGAQEIFGLWQKVFTRDKSTYTREHLTTEASATARIEEEVSEELFPRLDALLRNADYELDDLFESEFARVLQGLIIQGGKAIIHQIGHLFKNDVLHPEVMFDTLRLVGRIKDDESHQARKRLLLSQLIHPSRWARDGAAVGLASLEDISAIPALNNALENEQVEELKKDMKRVVQYLETIN